MKEKTKADLGIGVLTIAVIFGLGVTIAGGIVLILNALAVIGYFIVDVIR